MEEPIIESKPTHTKPKPGSNPKRMMTTSVTKPKLSTLSSTAAARTTLGTTLSKPPARPTVGSKLKNPDPPPSNAVRGQKARASFSSLDEDPSENKSCDEKQSKPALGPPKRLSIARSNTSGRLAPERKPLSQPTSISERKAAGRTSTASPTKTARPLSAASRPATKSSIPSSGTTTAGGAKKRLATIPASPMNRQVAKAEDEQQNAVKSIPEEPKGRGPMRPPLGSRQSTRSVAIQQRIQELQLVNEMLRAAMSAEDAGDDAKTEHLTTEVEKALTHLKTNLEPTEEASTAEKSTMLVESTESASSGERGYEQNRDIEGVQREEEELHTQRAIANTAVDQSKHSESVMELMGPSDSAEIAEMKNQYELEVASLGQKLQQLELSQKESAEQALKELEDAKLAATEAGDSKTAQLLEDQLSRHKKAVEALENDLALGREEIKQSAEKILQLEQEIEKQKAETASAEAKSEEHEKTIQSYQDQLLTRHHELQGQGAVVRNLEDEVAALQQARIAEAHSLKQASAVRVAELEEHIRALESTADQSVQESAVSRAHLQEEIIRQEKEISRLGEVIERLQDEIQNLHEMKSNELDKRLLQIREEHEHIIMALKAEHQSTIDRLAESHNTIVEKLGVEARNNRTAHEKHVQALEDEISKVQKSLDDTTSLLKASQDEAEKQVLEIESNHSKALEAANESLQKAEEALANTQQLLEETRKDAELTVATNNQTLEEKLRVVEGRAAKEAAALKSSRDDLEAAQKQVESLKQVLEAVEKDSQSKEEHHTDSLKRAVAEAEMARKTLAEKSASFESAGKDHAEAIENLLSGHEVELERVRRELTQKHDHVLKELQAKYDDLVAAHTDQETSQKCQMDQLKAEHDRALGDSSKLMADLQRVHLEELEEVKRQTADKNMEALRQLEEEFSKKAMDAEKIHNAALDDLKSTHEQTLRDLRAELEEEFSKKAMDAEKTRNAALEDLQSTHEKALIDLRAELEEESSKKAMDAEETHNAALEDLQSTHEKALIDLRSELEDSLLKSEEKTRISHEATVKGLQTRLEQQNAELEKAQMKLQQSSEPAENPELAKVRGELQASNDALTAAQCEISRLAHEVEDLKRRCEQDKKIINELESAVKKARTNFSTQQVHALREQLDGALQEAETQRVNSDIYREELQETTERAKEFKARIGGLEAKLHLVEEEAAVGTKASTPGSIRKRNRNKGSRKSPRLSQSKWASTPADEVQSDSSSPPKHDENLGSSIRGTIASIQEQLRQLDEVNEDMLEGHARMATMLSNVPELPIPFPPTSTAAISSSTDTSASLT